MESGPCTKLNITPRRYMLPNLDTIMINIKWVVVVFVLF
jgi:hypothetical protein